MNNFLKRRLDWLIKTLQILSDKLSLTSKKKLPFSSLAPLPNGDKQGYYWQTLKWALENRKEKEIRNIALTGPYGSGKSTVLKTFQESEKGNYKFLNISLATFREEKPRKDEEGNEIKSDKETLLRLIETSILEQIFYHESPDKIPDSRFKRITRLPRGMKFLYAGFSTILFFAVLGLIHPDLFRRMFVGISISDSWQIFNHWVLIFIVLVGLFFLLYKSIRIINSLTINKLTIQNAEIGFSGSNKSILNRHIDELVYFFTERPYDVVIIEDLDRFEETEIFTKLRELNLILNSSKKAKDKSIVFIYAVRDEMFIDRKERTKFFDFIIPIIPIINSTNSSEMLYKKRRDSNLNITDRLIESISFYIDDMRLLHNICNEFFVYRNLLDEKLLEDKLFAMIFYKNLYPIDFVKLTNNDGELYQIFDESKQWIKSELQKISNRTEDIQKEIEKIEALQLRNIDELRKLYIIEYIVQPANFHRFNINDNVISTHEMLQDENFDGLVKDRVSYQLPNGVRKSFGISFSQVEQRVDSSRSYKERELEIENYNSGKIDLLMEEIRELENRKKETRGLKIGDLIRRGHSLETDLLNGQLMKTLLRNQVIAEDYADYISLFHSVSITKPDFQFLLSVRSEDSLDFEYNLSNTEKLISKLDPEDFKTRYVLNYDLLNYLLTDFNKFEEQLLAIVSTLRNGSQHSIDFLLGFLKITPALEKFIELITLTWPGIWQFLQGHEGVQYEDRREFYKYLVEYSGIEALKKISDDSDLKNIIEHDTNFLNLLDDLDRIKEVISALNLRFQAMDFSHAPVELLKYVFEHRAYELNEHLIKGMIKIFGKLDPVKFEVANLSAIKESGCEELEEYIMEDIEKYIEGVYLKLKENTEDPEPLLIILLNHEGIELNNKEKILLRSSSKITDLTKVKTKALYNYLLDNSKVEPRWENLLYYFLENDNKLNDYMIQFLNDLDNAKALSETKIPTKYDSENTGNEFCQAFILAEEIDNTAYAKLIRSLPWVYPKLDVNELSVEKIKLLIDQGTFKATAENYDLLKRNLNPGLNIRLIESNPRIFIELKEEIDLDGDDLNKVLQSDRLKDLQKFEFTKDLPLTIITANQFNIIYLTDVILRNPMLELDTQVLEHIVMAKEVPVRDRIKMYILKKDRLSNLNMFQNFLNQLDGKYPEILHPSKKPKFPNDTDHIQLMRIAEEKGLISSFSVEKNKFVRVFKSR